jgi:Endonuclease NucS
MAIIISKNGKDARRLEETGVENEDYLQRYVFDNPESLPVDTIKDGARLMVIGREFPTASGLVDVLAVDRDGDLYVIETKLFKNPDKRKVVAQMLDYGAALCYEFLGDDFINALDSTMSHQLGEGIRPRMTGFARLSARKPDYMCRRFLICAVVKRWRDSEFV